MSTQLAKSENPTFQSFDVNQELPNLHEGTALPIDLTSDYWTPTQQGETKLCFFQEIKASTVKDDKSGETIELDCAFFIAQDEDGTTKTIRNGSVILVSTLFEYVEAGKLVKGTPLKLTFTGKRKTNKGNQVDTWSVRPILINVQ